jgi:hypothetical protein
LNKFHADVDNFVENQGFKYRKNDMGQPVGQPFCPRCEEADKMLISLQHNPGTSDWNRICPECKHEYLVDKKARDQYADQQQAIVDRQNRDYERF